MPSFSSALSAKNLERKLTPSELARAIRFSIAAEYEAIQIYQEIVEAIDDLKIKAVINDVIREEKVHAVQFLEVLYELEPQEKAAYNEGAKENQNLKAVTA